MAQIHILPLERETLHGHFSRDLPPVLTINAGDTVRTSTLASGWNVEPHAGGSHQSPRIFPGRVAGVDDGHALVGPIAVRGAEPGMTLVVEIGAIVPGTWGACFAGGKESAHNARLNVTGTGIVHAWELDPVTMRARNHLGHTVALRPFMGVMGMPPDEPGIHSTIPPRATGGNLDCKELVTGSTLYLPIAVQGALFSVGDGHGVQGDGEVSGTAIECPMERVELTFRLHDDFPLTGPVAQTPAGWVTMGLGEDVTDASYAALEAMLTLMSRLYDLERRDALALASLVVDLRVTQLVNGVRGVHAVLPPGALR